MNNTVVLACPTLRNEIEFAWQMSNSRLLVYFLPQRLHNDPKELHDYLQNMIDSFYNVKRIVICVSRCGGGTSNLLASSAELVLPRTRDCLDILLSGDSLETLQRDIEGVYFTKSWMDFSKNSDLDLGKLTAKMGKESAEAYLVSLYKHFNKFYIIDTGCYDLNEVEEYVSPLVKILNGSITILKGNFNILHKIAQGKFDNDFVTVRQGEMVSTASFLKNW